LCSRWTIQRVANYVRQQVSTSSIFDVAMRQKATCSGGAGMSASAAWAKVQSNQKMVDSGRMSTRKSV
jgi:hypothetical protein